MNRSQELKIQADEAAKAKAEAVYQLFEARCYQCHGADAERVRGGLALVDAAGVRAGGCGGRATPGPLAPCAR